MHSLSTISHHHRATCGVLGPEIRAFMGRGETTSRPSFRPCCQDPVPPQKSQKVFGYKRSTVGIPLPDHKSTDFRHFARHGHSLKLKRSASAGREFLPKAIPKNASYVQSLPWSTAALHATPSAEPKRNRTEEVGHRFKAIVCSPIASSLSPHGSFKLTDHRPRCTISVLSVRNRFGIFQDRARIICSNVQPEARGEIPGSSSRI